MHLVRTIPHIIISDLIYPYLFPVRSCVLKRREKEATLFSCISTFFFLHCIYQQAEEEGKRKEKENLILQYVRS